MRREERLQESMMAIPTALPSFAKTMLAQLGGPRFDTMVSTYNLVFDDKARELTLRFKARAKDGSNGLRITLTGRDTYDLKFFRIRGLSHTWGKELRDVQAMALQGAFTRQTGLDTHL